MRCGIIGWLSSHVVYCCCLCCVAIIITVISQLKYFVGYVHIFLYSCTLAIMSMEKRPGLPRLVLPSPVSPPAVFDGCFKTGSRSRPSPSHTRYTTQHTDIYLYTNKSMIWIDIERGTDIMRNRPTYSIAHTGLDIKARTPCLSRT